MHVVIDLYTYVEVQGLLEEKKTISLYTNRGVRIYVFNI